MVDTLRKSSCLLRNEVKVQAIVTYSHFYLQLYGNKTINYVSVANANAISSTNSRQSTPEIPNYPKQDLINRTS